MRSRRTPTLSTVPQARQGILPVHWISRKAIHVTASGEWPVLSRSEWRGYSATGERERCATALLASTLLRFQRLERAKARREAALYIHRNPVKRGLVERPEDWLWSSFHHYLTGEEGVVEIESHWTATRREKQGIYPTVRRRDPA